MRAKNWLRKFRTNQRGNVLVIAAAGMPLLIGSAAVGVDTIQLSLAKRQMQRSADSAALAGAYALVQSQNVATSVNHDLALNNDVPLHGAPVIQNAPTTGSYAGNNRAVRVALTSQRSLPFISFFTNAATTVSVEATAAIIYSGQFCMVSLENGNATGITFSGSTVVDLGCGVSTNSRSANGVSAGGSARVMATPIAAVGGVPSSGAYVAPTTLLPYSPQQTDPFAALPQPTVPADCNNQELRVQPNTSYTVPANATGVYCWRGMDIKGTLNLAPGTYYVDGGVLALGAQANVTGTGVTFVLTSSNATSDPSSIATLSMNGGAVLDVSAPTSGVYKGVLMAQDPRAPLGGSSQINGNSSSRFEGGFYFPRHDLTFNGNTGMRTECLQLVARRLTFTGNSSVRNVCPANGGAKAFDATFVRLVG